MAKTKIKFHDKKINRQVDREMTQRMRLIGEIIRGAIVRNISKPTRTLGPSRPGEPPHADTGTLRKSMRVEVVDDTTVVVGSDLDYASYLELGTSRMAPRPWRRKSLDDAREKVEKILDRTIEL